MKPEVILKVQPSSCILKNSSLSAFYVHFTRIGWSVAEGGSRNHRHQEHSSHCGKNVCDARSTYTSLGEPLPMWGFMHHPFMLLLCDYVILWLQTGRYYTDIIQHCVLVAHKEVGMGKALAPKGYIRASAQNTELWATLSPFSARLPHSPYLLVQCRYLDITAACNHHCTRLQTENDSLAVSPLRFAWFSLTGYVLGPKPGLSFAIECVVFITDSPTTRRRRNLRSANF